MVEAQRSPSYRLIVDKQRCHGCQSCMVACSLVHEGQVIPSLARIRIVLDPFMGEHTIRYCHQCRKAPCAASCPQEAIQWNAAGGFWQVEEALCTGCGACVEACPFGVMVVSPAAKARLCDTCHGNPECVQSCPTGALRWGTKAQAGGAR